MSQDIKMILNAVGVFTCVFLFLAIFVYIKYPPRYPEIEKCEKTTVTREEMTNALSYI